MQGLDRANQPGRKPLLADRGKPEIERGCPYAVSAFAVVLFADIVGSTRLCEDLDPAESFALLSDFHLQMARLMAAYGATIEDSIGDGVMAVWVAAAPEAGMLRRATSCAFAMRETVQRWSHDRVSEGHSAVRIGIGMHAGVVMVGRIGLPGRCKLGVFGDTVNVANRLEQMTRVFGTDLIISDDLFRAVAASAPTEEWLTRFHAVLTARIPGRASSVLIRTAHPI